MADKHDDFENPIPRQAPPKSVVDAVLDLAIKAGSSMVSVLSGLLAAALILYSGYVLVDTFEVERQASSNAWDLLQFRPEWIDDEDIPLDSPTLQQITPDYRAWLTVYDSPIDYPVVQRPGDDLYYASRDVYGRYSVTGAIYLAGGNSPDFSDSYNVIFGHHMESGAMFGGLDAFTGSAYFDSHRTGILVTPIGAFDITFFAVAATDAYEPRIYSYGDYASSVVDFLRSGGAGGVGLGTSVYLFDEEVAAQADRVVALSTCAAGDGTSGRLVVFGRMTEHIVYTDLTVLKSWEDNGDQDGLRPESLTVRLLCGSEIVAERTLTADGGWTATVEHLPMNRDGKALKYTWEEDVPSGYRLTGSVTEGSQTTLTNTRDNFKAVTLTLKKVWEDDDNRDGLRKPGYTLPVRLRGNGVVVFTDVLSDDNNWQTSITVPENRAGEPIEYVWEEDLPSGYELVQTSERTGDTVAWTFTNVHQPQLTERVVRKVWVDNENQDGMRPESLTVRLLQNGEPTGQEVVLSDENNWEGRITDLFVFDQGARIDYTWDEGEIPDYKLIRTQVDRKGIVTTLTNQHEPERITLSIRKRWQDVADSFHTRPESLTVRLMNLDNGTVAGTVTLTQNNSWIGTVTDLRRYADGHEIQYQWEEPEVPGYVLTAVEPDDKTPGRTLLTNSLIRRTEATVEKRWLDSGSEALRPEALSVTLLANGKPVTQDADGAPIENPMLLTAENNWTLTVENLEKYDRDGEISYTFEETVPEGYIQLSAETEAGRTVLTNTAMTESTVLKVWDDDDDHDGLRPATLPVTLTANGEPVTADALGNPIEPVVLSEENGWTATVANLPAYSEGEPIVYSWTEPEVEGYVLTVKTEGTLTTLINETLIDQTIIKVWDDDNDRDHVRPMRLHVYLLYNGMRMFESPEGFWQQDLILDDENEWTGTISGLRRRDEHGDPIVYTWSEDEVEYYRPEFTTEYDEEHRITTMTNTHDVYMVDKTIVKLWNDNDDQDGRRPDHLDVWLLGNERRVTRYADGTPFENPVTLREDAEGNWTFTAVGLPLNDKGEKIEYTWEEIVPEGYREISHELDPTDPDGNRTIITNEHIPSVDMYIIKRWEADIAAVRPASIDVTLSGGGQSWTITLDAEHEWSGMVESVPQQDENGDRIEYTWTETVPEGYTLVESRLEGNVGVIVNRRTIDLNVRKVWVDNNPASRPQTLRMVLSGGGRERGVVELSEANHWTGTVTGLPQYDEAGREIAYTWTEPTIPGYRLTSQTREGNTTVFTNTRNNGGGGGPRTYTLTIYYRYEDGTTAAETYVRTLSEGDTYDVPSPVIPGYRASLVRVAGTMPGHDVVYTVIYVREETEIIEEPGTPLGLGQVYINIGDCLE